MEMSATEKPRTGGENGNCIRNLEKWKQSTTGRERAQMRNPQQQDVDLQNKVTGTGSSHVEGGRESRGNGTGRVKVETISICRKKQTRNAMQSWNKRLVPVCISRLHSCQQKKGGLL